MRLRHIAPAFMAVPDTFRRGSRRRGRAIGLLHRRVGRAPAAGEKVSQDGLSDREPEKTSDRRDAARAAATAGLRGRSTGAPSRARALIGGKCRGATSGDWVHEAGITISAFFTQRKSFSPRGPRRANPRSIGSASFPRSTWSRSRYHTRQLRRGPGPAIPTHNSVLGSAV